jgi:hypothetical protein
MILVRMPKEKQQKIYDIITQKQKNLICFNVSISSHNFAVAF